MASSIEVVDVPTTSLMSYVCAMAPPFVAGTRLAPSRAMILATGRVRPPRDPRGAACSAG